MTNIIKKIEVIGVQLVSCKLNCAGVVNDPSKGIIPRCLIYEKRNASQPNVIVVGINPGKCNKDEKNYYLKSNNDYKAVTDYWHKKITGVAYYKKSREILTTLGFNGDILWTDLAKCECLEKNGDVPIQTLRICIDEYLAREIKVFSKQITIIALGNVAFNYCALRFPDFFVLGLPHPTGAWGTFGKLKKNIQKNPKKYLNMVNHKLDNFGHIKAVKLFN